MHELFIIVVAQRKLKISFEICDGWVAFGGMK